MSIQLVVSKQNRDGGWPYVRGTSWTEPTVYAILALLAAGELEPARRGLKWLRAAQLSDGGWPPQTGFDESTWVTALVALVPPDQLGDAAHARAIDWLLGTSGEESSRDLPRASVASGHAANARSTNFRAGPGFPARRRGWDRPRWRFWRWKREAPAGLRRRSGGAIEEGRSSCCGACAQGGGWNHGSVRALGYESTPYPETTGMALAALRGVRSRETESALNVADRFLRECRSADALNWLRIGLMAHCPPARQTTARRHNWLAGRCPKRRSTCWWRRRKRHGFLLGLTFRIIG